MFQLYDYQLRGKINVKELFKTGYKRLIFQLPTGGGKTVIFADMAANNKGKTLILTDRQEIAKGSSGDSGTVGTIRKFGITSEVIQAVKNPVYDTQSCVCMIQTLQNRLEKGDSIEEWVKWLHTFNLVIIDECHEGIFDFVFKHFNEKRYVIGFTATPSRSGGMNQLGMYYHMIVFGSTMEELIQIGQLVQPTYYHVPGVNTENVKVINGKKGFDYKDSELFKEYDKKQVYAGAVSKYTEHAANKKTIVYAISVLHAARLCREFNEAGHKAMFVCGGFTKPKLKGDTETDKAHYYLKMKEFSEINEINEKYNLSRKDSFNWFEKTEGSILINVGIATKGYDCPSIECAIMCFDTISVVKWFQTVGRAIRKSKGKTEAIVIDMGGNLERFGPVEKAREWGLWFDKKEGEGVAPVKICGDFAKPPKIDVRGIETCGAIIPASANVCPICGYIHKKTKKQVEADFIKANTTEIKIVSDMNVSEIIAFGMKNGYKRNWAMRKIFSIHKIEGIIEAGTILNYRRGFEKHLKFL